MFGGIENTLFSKESCLKPLAIPLRGMLSVSARRDRKHTVFEGGRRVKVVTLNVKIHQAENEVSFRSADADDLLTAVNEGILSMEDAADAMLAAHGALGRKNGIYTQRQLDRKIRNESARLETMKEGGVDDNTADYLAASQIDDLVEVSNLTAFQEICYRMYLAGFNQTDIAVLLGIRRQTISKRLAAARSKVMKAYCEGRYAGWYEVYLSEVRRRGKR